MRVREHEKEVGQCVLGEFEKKNKENKFKSKEIKLWTKRQFTAFRKKGGKKKLKLKSRVVSTFSASISMEEIVWIKI